jgi:excisionase family DNA binding protein
MDQGATQYLEVSDLAEHFQVSRKTVIGWIRSGKLRAIQPGGRHGAYRIPATELERLKGGIAA